jgi:hypothetical protein
MPTLSRYLCEQLLGLTQGENTHEPLVETALCCTSENLQTRFLAELWTFFKSDFFLELDDEEYIRVDKLICSLARSGPPTISRWCSLLIADRTSFIGHEEDEDISLSMNERASLMARICVHAENSSVSEEEVGVHQEEVYVHEEEVHVHEEEVHVHEEEVHVHEDNSDDEEHISGG